MILRWLLYFIPALVTKVLCYITVPIAVCFVVKRPRVDTVKRLNRQTVNIPREYLWGFFNLWNTHDNAADEGWYGMYDLKIWWLWWIDASTWTQVDYDNSSFIRWYCRVFWLQRNCAYGLHYSLFSRPTEPLLDELVVGKEYFTPWLRIRIFKSSFQIESHVPLWADKYMSINFGWKEHKNMPRKLYAMRMIGPVRNYKK